MAIRYLKIVLLLCVALQALIYALQNIVNLEQAYGAVAYVMSNQDHVAYPGSIFPSITAPALIWLALVTVLIGEFGAGLLGLKGSWDLWKAKGGDATEFNDAKTIGILACGVATVTWFGLFLVIGSTAFQMWQTEVGSGSLRDSSIFVTANLLVLIYLTMKDE